MPDRPNHTHAALTAEDRTVQAIERTADVTEKMRRGMTWLALATVVLYIAVVWIGYKTYTNSAETKDALCTLQADLVKRISASRDYLEKHPNGAPGIATRKEIETQIDSQGRTIRALSVLHCD